MSTRGVQILKQKNVSYELVTYDHLEKGAEFAAKSTGFPLSRTIKTLVADLGNKQYCLAMLPGDRQLNLKQLARAMGVKRAAMVDTGTAERITGYKVGGISPFGTRQSMKSVLDSSLLEFDTVLINAGQRGSMFRLSPSDICSTLGCLVKSVCN